MVTICNTGGVTEKLVSTELRYHFVGRDVKEGSSLHTISPLHSDDEGASLELSRYAFDCWQCWPAFRQNGMHKETFVSVIKKVAVSMRPWFHSIKPAHSSQGLVLPRSKIFVQSEYRAYTAGAWVKIIRPGASKRTMPLPYMLKSRWAIKFYISSYSFHFQAFTRNSR